MNSTNQSEKSVSNGVHLLISLLIRYPEIGTVTFDPDHHTLKLSFMFHNLPEQEDFAALEQSLLQSLHTYYRLERFRQPLVNLSVKTVASLI
ncbi:MAG: hypothetical protein E6713_18180, partial [Sporomusaceae bacterium]|nr:hypothetical protein [Sporomusaceae bacterium]